MKMLAMAIIKTLPMMMMMAMIDEDVIAIAVIDGLKCMTADLAPAMTLAMTTSKAAAIFLTVVRQHAVSVLCIHTWLQCA